MIFELVWVQKELNSAYQLPIKRGLLDIQFP
jgi:hypothetical protein